MKNLLLVGNPNTGKTTFFNSLTKSNEHIGNWHGVTVDSKSKVFSVGDKQFNLIDLPGAYSLTPLSLEEKVTTDYIFSHTDDLIINIVDINNIKRNLYLTTDLINFGAKVMLVINKTSKHPNFNVDIKALEKELNISVFMLDASNRKEIKKFKEFLSEYSESSSKLSFSNNANIPYELTDYLKKSNVKLKTEFVANKILENDENIIKYLNLNEEKINKILNKNNNNLQFNNFQQKNIANKYQKIETILSKCCKKVEKKTKFNIDKILLNKFISIPIFIGILLLAFYLTFFSLGAFLSELVRNFFQNVIGNFINGIITKITTNEIIISFFDTAVVGGFVSLLGFLPQVVLMFLFLGILEDSGYLSRIAFMFDDIFAKVGLSGKAIYTLLMGFGCGTTATMTARNMENERSKIKTALLTPYMSCSAKLPIYCVIGGAFFGAKNVFIVFLLYLLGVIVALTLSVILDRVALKSKEQSFILEFPSYRIPSPKRLGFLVWDNMKQFLIRIGSLLFTVNIIVWVLCNFSFSLKFVQTSSEKSILETLGVVLSPIFVPLGFGSWGATSALIAGLIAKEIIVSSIAMFNNISVKNQDVNSQIGLSLSNPSSAVYLTPAGALSYMVFCLLYMPCVANMIMLKKEVGKKWFFISILIQFGLAYLISLIVYNAYRFIQIYGALAVILLALVIFLVLFAVYKTINISKSCKRCHKCKKCKGKC